MPARRVLRPGDVISAVDGRQVTCAANAGTLIKARRPGTPLNLTIIRKGEQRHVRLVSTKVQGQAVIGVNVQESFLFPFAVKINVKNIGGPSAGLMFALGIIDKLTPMNLTAGMLCSLLRKWLPTAACRTSFTRFGTLPTIEITYGACVSGMWIWT